MGIPYFLSAQLDNLQKEESTGSGWLEGWIGLLVFNVATWVAIVVIDIMLLSNEFKIINTPHHVLQTGALVSVCASAATILFFTATGFLFMNDAFCSTPGRDAKTLPPFATSLISGGLKATLGFSYLLVFFTAPTYGMEGGYPNRVLELLVAQICLKHFGSAMALANQRLHLFSSEPVSNATS